MQRLNTISRSRAIGGAALVGFVVLFEVLDGLGAWSLIKLLGCGKRTALELVLVLLPAAWQVVQANVFQHHWFSLCPLEMLVSFWPLLHVVAGAL